MNSKEKFHKIQQILLILIASTIFFRSVCTLLIIIFSVFSVLNFKHLSFSKKHLFYIGFIALPLILEILFFWNNDSLKMGMKSLEKNLSLVLLPVFIIGSYQNINFKIILNYFRYISTSILLVLLIRFAIISPDLVQKYINGIHLWEMGYMFANSFKNHAPVVNMHIAFLIIVHVYFLLKEAFSKQLVINILLILVSVFSLFVVNTRISLATTIVGVLLVVADFVIKKKNISLKKTLKIAVGSSVLIIAVLFVAFKTNPYMKEKYGNATFAYMDKIGKLDEIEHPETRVFNAFVTRLSIWKSAWELGNKSPVIGYGSSDGKKELVHYFETTNQKFLAKYEFPVHNQPLDYFLKYGFIGLISVLIYLLYPIFLGIKSREIIMVFFGLNFLISNLFDDFLIRFDGIVFYGLWVSLATAAYFKTDSK